MSDTAQREAAHVSLKRSQAVPFGAEGTLGRIYDGTFGKGHIWSILHVQSLDRVQTGGLT